jgi:hypothetical protein
VLQASLSRDLLQVFVLVHGKLVSSDPCTSTLVQPGRR